MVSGVQVRVLLDQERFSAFIIAYIDRGKTAAPTVARAQKMAFSEFYGGWLNGQTGNAQAIFESVRVEGVAGSQRYFVVTFGEADGDCAMLFKLTFGGR